MLSRSRQTIGLAFGLGFLGVGFLPGCQGPAPSGPKLVDELPLTRGYYVEGGDCARASNATLTLNTGDGLNGARARCTFTRIEQVGARRYDVTERCVHLRGEEEERALSITVEDQTSYTLGVDGSTWHSKHCPQESLPEPWRSNDIGRHLRTE